MDEPAFDSLFGTPPAEQVPNPLDSLNYPGDLEGDATSEVNAAYEFVVGERQKYRDRFRLMTDPDYWFAVCFQSRDQKEEFLRAVGWLENGDKYLDGLWVAQKMGVPIVPVALPAREGTFRTPKLLRREVLE